MGVRRNGEVPDRLRMVQLNLSFNNRSRGGWYKNTLSRGDDAHTTEMTRSALHAGGDADTRKASPLRSKPGLRLP